MKKTNYLLPAALLAGALCGCGDDAADGGGRPEAGAGVNFALEQVTTRAAFDSDNTLQINWTSGDKVRIYCDEAEDVRQADYEVVEPTADNKHKSTLKYNPDGLAWGTDDGTHNFYAVYPADDGKVSVSDGVATFKVNYNQTCTVSGTADANGHYATTPDMTNAYMVASLSTKPVEEVSLSFRPIMTTLEVTVRGHEGSNASAVRVTGISVVNNSVQYSDATTGKFRYDIKNSTILGLNEGTSTKKGSIFVGVKNGNNHYIDLAGGQSVTFTVFLPPVPIDKDNQIAVNVHTTAESSATYSVTVGGNTDASGNTISYPASSKGAITLGYVPTTGIGNNWITPLDGSIYVSQMSIPGSHDAGSGEDMATIVGDVFAQTQTQTLDKQWDMGVRAFDLRPAIRKSKDELWLYHGMCRVSISWATAMNNIKAKLKEQPGEFAIVLFRHEDEKDLINLSDKNNNVNDFDDAMTKYVEQNKNLIVDWKPDLTIDEVRGKIILISRFEGSWTYGCFTGWGHGQEGATTTLKNVDGSKSATMYVQDYYNPSSHAAKWSSIENFLNISRTFHTDAAKVNHWMINHCSGYVGTSSTRTYRNNAAYQNPKLIEYLTSDTWEGSTGIMLFDYAAASQSDNTNVYGDVALQAIIDNNYKYRMKRKGE